MLRGIAGEKPDKAKLRLALSRVKLTGRADCFGYGVACPEKLPGATSMGCGELSDLSYDAVYLVDEIGVIAMLSECGNKRSVVPECAVLFAAKPFEHLKPVSS